MEIVMGKTTTQACRYADHRPDVYRWRWEDGGLRLGRAKPLEKLEELQKEHRQLKGGCDLLSVPSSGAIGGIRRHHDGDILIQVGVYLRSVLWEYKDACRGMEMLNEMWRRGEAVRAV